MNNSYKQHTDLPYSLRTDVETFDMSRLYQWLSKQAYWSEGIPFDVMETAFKNSVSFGLFHSENNIIVGCARAITDKATFAYIADVYIEEPHRGLGLGKWLVDGIMAHPDLQGLRRMMLATQDMHALYKQVGFSEVHGSKLLMEIVKPDIYKGSQ